MNIKILNEKEIQKKISDSVVVMSKTVSSGLVEVGERAVEILDRNTPVQDGRLRASMSYTTDGKVVDPLRAKSEDDKLRKITENDKIVVGTNVKYAPKVEYLAQNGSAGFMLRSYKQLVPIAKKVLETVLKRGFK